MMKIYYIINWVMNIDNMIKWEKNLRDRSDIKKLH